MKNQKRAAKPALQTHKLSVIVTEENGILEDVNIIFNGQKEIFIGGMVAPMGKRKEYDTFLELLCVSILRRGVEITKNKTAAAKKKTSAKKPVSKKSIAPKKKKK